MTRNKARIAVLISGNGSNLQAILDAAATGALAHGTVELVISSSSQAYGITRARDAGVPVDVVRRQEFATQAEFDDALSQIIDQYQIDLIVLAGYMNILSKQFVERYPNRIVNVHPSLIPAFSGPGFYGLKVHEAVVAAGVKVSGATVHYVTEVCDGGQILAQETVPVYETDTPQDVQKRVLTEVEHIIYPRVIEQLSKEIAGN
ncbi:phosphoribosylglycinamide formyltransferase [Arcanobacterium phocae]|uniref:Phosphoribosylglycinamide formyltransferase n=1 Tax=Arcanobacterium phocae TaxID=131112 RepID=A0A1H2LLK9_9ACTO|nr:phosphoribosylglycinamide formyltransferase [Arcanobacterium phocae]SDU81276.1 formyltetrahydrofolate-dependent phosphoribosylglycinamide formyltransferase [Arcanobacterium phocae]